MNLFAFPNISCLESEMVPDGELMSLYSPLVNLIVQYLSFHKEMKVEIQWVLKEHIDKPFCY